jgi:RimJ/RimL family protein N-acetyltransferase
VARSRFLIVRLRRRAGHRPANEAGGSTIRRWWWFAGRVSTQQAGLDSIATDRLLLRRWRPGDLDALSRVFAKPEVWWFPFKRGWTVEETNEFLDRKLAEWETRGWSQWAVIEKGAETLIGFLGLAPPDFLPEVMPAVEVGWRLDPDYWGHGLATEGGRAALDTGFRVLQLEEIVSVYEPENVASGRVMERLGMVHDRDTTHPKLGVPLRVMKMRRDAWMALDR